MVRSWFFLVAVLASSFFVLFAEPAFFHKNPSCQTLTLEPRLRPVRCRKVLQPYKFCELFITRRFRRVQHSFPCGQGPQSMQTNNANTIATIVHSSENTGVTVTGMRLGITDKQCTALEAECGLTEEGGLVHKKRKRVLLFLLRSASGFLSEQEASNEQGYKVCYCCS